MDIPWCTSRPAIRFSPTVQSERYNCTMPKTNSEAAILMAVRFVEELRRAFSGKRFFWVLRFFAVLYQHGGRD